MLGKRPPCLPCMAEVCSFFCALTGGGGTGLMGDFGTLPLCRVLVTALWPPGAVGLGTPGRDGHTQACEVDLGD